MITDSLEIQIVDSPEKAPHYSKEKYAPTILVAKKAIIVGKGMVSGAPSVDLQLEDQAGNKYLVMATGGILEMLAGAVRGKRERDHAAGLN